MRGPQRVGAGACAAGNAHVQGIVPPAPPRFLAPPPRAQACTREVPVMRRYLPCAAGCMGLQAWKCLAASRKPPLSWRSRTREELPHRLALGKNIAETGPSRDVGAPFMDVAAGPTPPEEDAGLRAPVQPGERVEVLHAPAGPRYISMLHMMGGSVSRESRAGAVVRCRAVHTSPLLSFCPRSAVHRRPDPGSAPASLPLEITLSRWRTMFVAVGLGSGRPVRHGRLPGTARSSCAPSSLRRAAPRG